MNQLWDKVSYAPDYELGQDCTYYEALYRITEEESDADVMRLVRRILLPADVWEELRCTTMRGEITDGRVVSVLMRRQDGPTQLPAWMTPELAGQILDVLAPVVGD